MPKIKIRKITRPKIVKVSEKICKKCKKMVDAKYFTPAKGRKDGLAAVCKYCINKSLKQPCALCFKFETINSNGNCIGCNKRLGVKECNKCRQVKMSAVFFNGPTSRKCETCLGTYKEDPNNLDKIKALLNHFEEDLKALIY